MGPIYIHIYIYVIIEAPTKPPKAPTKHVDRWLPRLAGSHLSPKP